MLGTESLRELGQQGSIDLTLRHGDRQLERLSVIAQPGAAQDARPFAMPARGEAGARLGLEPRQEVGDHK